MQLAQRLAQIHPDKLLGTLEQHVTAGHEQSALQAIPDLQLAHPEMAAELEQIKRKLSDKLLDHVKVLNPEQATVFRCGNCGAGLSRQHPDTVHVICHYCGVDAEHPADQQVLERWNKALDLEARFTIGDMFEFEGLRWQAVGVQLFSGQIREWDGEDNVWERSSARYTNWWMLNENRELRWLVDDGNDRYWAEKTIPDHPKLPDQNDRTCEHGSWTLEFAAGEFTYQPHMNEQHLSAEMRGGRKPKVSDNGRQERAGRFTLSVESQLDEQGNVREVEFIRSRKLSDDAILQGLARGSELSDMKRWRNTTRAFMFTIFIVLASYLFSDSGGTEETSTVPLDLVSKDVLVREFNIDKAGTMLKLRGVVNRVSSNAWFGVNLRMEDSDQLEIYEKYVEFWHESGRDSDGAWSENDLATNWFVRFDEPGTFKLFASVEPASTTRSVQFSLNSESGRVSMTPFLLAGVMAAVLAFLCRGKRASLGAAAASIALRLNPRRDKPSDASA